MGPPIPAKTLQNKQLSAKKSGNKNLKNVLSQPHHIDWPILRHEQGEKLEKVLKKLLPILKSSQEKTQWSILRKMSKEERSLARKKLQLESKKQTDNEDQNPIVFGINAVTRSLEKNNLCCILLDSNVDPMMLIKHIVIMARNKNLPILLVKFLKSITNETLGFSSAAIGLKNFVAEFPQNNFHELFTKVSNIFLEFFTSSKPTNITKIESISIDKSNEIINISTSCAEENSPMEISSDVYLYKTENQKRIFQPSNSLADQGIPNHMDFISIKTDEEFECSDKMPLRFFHSPNDTRNLSKKNESLCKQNKKENDRSKGKINTKNGFKTNYISMKVKRIQGSDYRSKATKPSKIKKSKK